MLLGLLCLNLLIEPELFIPSCRYEAKLGGKVADEYSGHIGDNLFSVWANIVALV